MQNLNISGKVQNIDSCSMHACMITKYKAIESYDLQYVEEILLKLNTKRLYLEASEN